VKRSIRLATACALFLSAAPGVSAAQSDDTALKSIEQAWVTASVQSDRATLDKLLDDSFIEIMPSGASRSKSDLLIAQPPTKGSTQSLQDVQVRVYGDSAVVTGINRYAAPGMPAHNFAFTDVYVRSGDSWRAVATHISRK
jgi:hypothetical protein